MRHLFQSTAVLTAPAIFAASGMNRSSSEPANGTGVCGPVTIWIGARSDPNASCATVAAMSVASEQRGLASSTTTRRPVFSTDSRIVSVSSGETVRGSMISHSHPGRRQLGRPRPAPCCTMRPIATIVTSSPSRTTLASPNGIA